MTGTSNDWFAFFRYRQPSDVLPLDVSDDPVEVTFFMPRSAKPRQVVQLHDPRHPATTFWSMCYDAGRITRAYRSYLESYADVISEAGWDTRDGKHVAWHRYLFGDAIFPYRVAQDRLLQHVAKTRPTHATIALDCLEALRPVHFYARRPRSTAYPEISPVLVSTGLYIDVPAELEHIDQVDEACARAKHVIGLFDHPPIRLTMEQDDDGAVLCRCEIDDHSAPPAPDAAAEAPTDDSGGMNGDALPDPASIAELQKLAGIERRDDVSRQLVAALKAVGKAAPKSVAGSGRKWSHSVLRQAYPKLRPGKLSRCIARYVL